MKSRLFAAAAPVLVAVAALDPAQASGLRIDLDSVEPAPETFSLEDLGHYRWVLDDDQRALYEDGDEAARRELMRVVWAKLDPTPTTPENEGKDEHFRRLAYVRETFPSPMPPWWDDRGMLLIRYGAPESRTVSIGDARKPVRETWVYGRLGLAFELEANLGDRFTMIVRPSKDMPRADQVLFEPPIEQGMPHVVFSAPGFTPIQPKDMEAEAHATRFERLLDRGAETLAACPHVYVHDYGGEWLPVAFDAVSFASSEPGLTRLEIHTGLRAADLAYQSDEGTWRAVLTTDAVAKTTDYREVARVAKVTRDRRASVDNLEGRVVMDGVNVFLDPGSYVLALAVRDTTSHRTGVFQRPVEVLRFAPGELAVSGIQTAFDVEDAAAPDVPFRKANLQVAPWPYPQFPKGRNVHLYFEIYGLQQSPTGDTFFRVEMLLQPRDPKKRGWFGSSKGRARTGVATSWEGRGHGDVAREHVALDTASLGPGTFDISLTVTDEVGDAVAERTTAITISE